MTARRVPFNVFAISFGIAGLAGTWLALAHLHRAPVAVGDALLVLAALAWVAALICYLRYALTTRGALARDLLDPIGSPFASLVVVVPMLLFGQGLYPHAAATGRVLVDVCIALTVLAGAWFTGQWIYVQVPIASLHPGYFLPTVAGGLIAATSAATVGQPGLAKLMFGLGIVCWVVLGSVILGRLLLGPPLPKPLIPTLAIEVAPSAVATLAYFAIHGDSIDFVASLLGGYGLLMVLAQIRLLPVYIRLPFMPSTWAFTFSWAAVATAAVLWLQQSSVAGARVWQYVVAVLVSALVGGVGVRTIIAIATNTYLPAPQPAPESTGPAEPVAPETSQENPHVHA